MTFQELGLIAPITQALSEMGYRHPTPIQEKAIPPALKGRDVLGSARTGTGKTCAFAAPILQRLYASPVQGRPIRSLILTPTRELALQDQENIELYAKHLPLRSAVIFGGVGQNPQVEALKQGTDILVATPGRLMDLYQQQLLQLTDIEILVLDEADRMLDMGFIHDVRKILRWLPEKKQTLLFSATMPQEIVDLVNSLLHDPVRVAVDPVSSPVEVIRQSVYFVDKGNKTKLLAHLLQEQQAKNALVFTRTKHGANKVAKDLEKLGISAAAIHGNKSQTARQQALADFKEGRVTVLVATDIAARGLDIEELSHVFNYNLPEVPETYIHRIGRTGRAGRGGTAIALCDYAEKPLLREIEKLTGKKIPVVEDHPYPMQIFEEPPRDKNGKVINPEDAEARAAAREQSEAHRAARNAKTDSGKQSETAGAGNAPQKKKQGEKTAQNAAAPSAGAQAPDAARRGKNPTPAQKAETQLPDRDDYEDPIAPRERPKLVRPGIHLDTGDAMPVVEFTKPDPLAGEHIMDATARLLAPKQSAASARSSGSQKKTQGKKDGSGGQKQKKKSGGAQPEAGARKQGKPEAKPQEDASQGKKQGQSGTKGKKKNHKSKAPASGDGKTQASSGSGKPQTPSGSGKEETKQKTQAAPEGRKSSSRHAGGRKSGGEPQKPHTKDSTEQPSLMKPFYLSRDDE